MTLYELSQADQTAAHRRDFMEWWSTTMWAGRSDRWAMPSFVKERAANSTEPSLERAICRAFLTHHGKWKD